MGGGLACEYEEIHIISVCEARQRTDVIRYTHYHLGAKRTDTMGTVADSPWGRDCGEGWWGGGEVGKVWGLRMRTGAQRPQLINWHSLTSCSYLIKQTHLCSSCWEHDYSTSAPPFHFHFTHWNCTTKIHIQNAGFYSSCDKQWVLLYWKILGKRNIKIMLFYFNLLQFGWCHATCHAEIISLLIQHLFW